MPSFMTLRSARSHFCPTALAWSGSTFRAGLHQPPPSARRTRCWTSPPGSSTPISRGRCRTFEIPLGLAGTPFQLRIWSALRDIPFGETRCYGRRGFRARVRRRARTPLSRPSGCLRLCSWKRTAAFSIAAIPRGENGTRTWEREDGTAIHRHFETSAATEPASSSAFGPKAGSLPFGSKGTLCYKGCATRGSS